VMLTTPYMDEASRCNRLGFMRAGQVIAEGTPTALRAKLNGRILEIPTPEPLLLRAQVLGLPGVDDARPLGDRLHVRTSAGAADQVIEAFNQLAGSLPSHQAARLISPTLEDVFLSYITDPQEGPQ